MNTVTDFALPVASSAAPHPTREPAGPTCEAFAVSIGYIWLMVLAAAAGLVIALVSLTSAPSLPVLALAAALVALGYLAWRRGYRAVRLELRPGGLRSQPLAPGQPAQEVPLAHIANYLRPSETYYQVLELQLHGGSRLRYGKRLRTPGPGLLTLDDWTEALATRLEAARPAPATAAGALASGLAAARPRILARTAVGKVLAGVAIVWLLLAGVVLLDPSQHVPGWVFMAPGLYMTYFFRARGALKVQTQVSIGRKANEDDDQDDDWKNNQNNDQDNS